ncbi:hypothetical protein DV736_g1669, partial [Chaetothyriales sp. CBS 134916]
MRLSIRDQLALLVLLCSLTALMVLALAVWFQNYHFVTNIRLSGLALTASLKATQVSSTLLLYQAQVESIASRSLIQSALQRFNAGTTTASSISRTLRNQTRQNWNRTLSDIQGALANGNLLVQSIVFPSFNTTNSTSLSGLLKVTAMLDSEVHLPYGYPNGTQVSLGDPELGYPPMLYPNLTYAPNDTSGLPQAQSVMYDGQQVDPRGMLILGPLVVNDTYALLSVTVAIVNDTSGSNILGWLTVVIAADMVIDIARSPEGLGDTGEVLLVGPLSLDNRYPQDPSAISPGVLGNYLSKFEIPPNGIFGRHKTRVTVANYSLPFNTSSYPAVLSAWSKDNNAVNNKGAYISTRNEDDTRVAAGYARIAAPYVDWTLIVELAYDEVVAPINHLRNVVLICVFSVTGLLLLTIFPLAHYSIAPIRQLRNATLKTIEPYQSEDASDLSVSHHEHATDVNADEADKERFFSFAHFRRPADPKRLRKRRTFRIPSKVPERKHWVTDELTELTNTFNDMSDELAMQYERLEQRVKERTAELEASKITAEVANQSKTLFIANISHELKTPLNGILGLTAVCMNEDDPGRVRSTLHTIYKLGDLLLHLLTDLLTFSKNEIGSSVSIDEAEFRLSDLSAQLIPTFEKQAREAQIDFKLLYLGTNDAFGNANEYAGEKLYGPSGTGIVRDMYLSGDKNRILQVLMNFVSNGLKFTPPHGSVTVRVRCIGLFEDNHFPSQQPSGTRKSSTLSRRSKGSSGKRARIADSAFARRADADDKDYGRDVSCNGSVEDTNKLSISVGGGTTQIAKIAERRRSMSPRSLNAKDLTFDFEVEDTGPGIPEDQQKKIFEPFVQGDLGLSKKYGGTGLGLSICAQLAGLMGGAISLDSTPGHGSKFTMRIPLRYVTQRTSSSTSSIHRSHSKTGSVPADVLSTPSHPHASTSSLPNDRNDTNLISELKLADVPRIVGFTQPYVAKETQPDSAKAKLKEMQQAEKEAAKQGKKVRVLVAEDNPVNQEVVLRMLKLEHVYDVTIAKDGQEALEKVQESMAAGGRFDLVFMDVQMPNLDGIQSARLIREAGFKSPIVALTAFSEKSNEDECMASGMDYFLAKPIRRPALKHVLKKYAPIPEEENEVPPTHPPQETEKEQPSNGDYSGNKPNSVNAETNTTLLPSTPTEEKKESGIGTTVIY